MWKFLKQLLQEDAAEAIDLVEGEQILHVTGRHWVILLGRLIPPFLGIAFFGGLASYRAIGGSFLVEMSAPNQLDPVNWLLTAAVIVLLLFWTALWVRRPKNKRVPNLLLGISAVILIVIYYRYEGGRLFYVDPGMFANQATDIWNIILITLAVISLLFVFFTVYDWLNDELILTNRRVIYDDDQVYIPRLLERRRQEQIYIEDVQDVVAATKTYPQHWLKFGNVIVKSARIGGQISFTSANEPKLMQKKIMDQVGAYRKQSSEQNFQRMIEEKVYNAPAEKRKYRKDIRTTQAMRALSWLLPENPEINEDNGTITWRAHWLFHLRALIGPFLLLFGGWLVVLIAARLMEIEPVVLTLLLLGVFVIFIAWAAYENEDYRNDLYILTPTNVIDIEKKPFGPEDRRQASLGAINNVSFNTTFFSNLIGYGDVVLETAGGGGKFTFDNVPRPRDVVQKINDYQVDFKRGEKERAMNDTLTLLRHYHTAQQRHNELNIPPA